ncbi:MAG: Gfo/Idh/MocA family oxidoreductase [Acidobacteria bacterium]|nr:Gfo/Idh/MocA family oxidoreductase [Acidobacteriota bacterium]
MVHENWRWQPWYREIKRRIDAGDIGRPITYHFRIRQRDGLGSNPYPNQPYFAEMARLLVYETLIHPIDTARFIFGDIATLFARLRRYNPLIAGEDRAILTLTHSDGTDGIIDGHRFLNPEPPGPAMGDSLFEGDAGALRVLANGEIHSGGECVWRYSGPEGYKGDSVLATQRHFIDALRTGSPFETGLSEYAQSFLAVDAAYRSATEARAVSLE